MKFTQRALTLGVAMSLAPALGWGQTPALDAPTRSLIDQAQFWQQRGRGDRAAEAWQKLLRIVPDQPDALIGMARVKLSEGDSPGALQFLTRLKGSHPGDSRIAALESDLNQANPARQSQLEEARTLARAGKSEEAVQRYKDVTDGRAPTDPRLALEYYQTLGGTRGGWQEGYAGLQKLARENPDDPQIALALAEHLTFQERTRATGINSLARLAERPELAKRARESWRRALGWLGTGPADATLYQVWLKQNPDDTEIRTRLELVAQRRNNPGRGQESAQSRAAALAGRSIASAYATLDEGDLPTARARFNAILEKQPGNSAAIGGLGLIELRESHFAEAEGLLSQAARTEPSRWRSALLSARYWLRFEEARQAREAGESERAIELLRSCVKAMPNEPAGQQALGDVLAEAGHLEEAYKQFSLVLKQKPGDIDAIRGLLGVMAQQGKMDEVLAMADALTPAQRDQLGPLGALRAERYRRLATEAQERGDFMGARSALEEALANDPNNVWVRLDLAKSYQRDGALPEARGLVDGLLMSNPGMPDALYASALLSVEAHDWEGVLATLQAIRPEARTRQMDALYSRAWVQMQVERAADLSRNGDPGAGLVLLRQVEPYVGNDADLLSAVAAGYADAGDSAHSLNMIRSLMSRNAKPDTALTLRYAGILQASKQQVELAGVLRQLQGMPMDAAQQARFDSLRMDSMIQQADSFRETGDLEAGYERLAPVLAVQPDNLGAQGALARLYVAAGQHNQALAIYDQLLARQPNDFELILAGGGSALGARQLDRAQNLADAGLQVRPQDARALSLAGRVARAQGRTRDAEQLLRAALASEEAGRRTAYLNAQPSSGALALQSGSNGISATQSLGGNPFAGITGRRNPGTLGYTGATLPSAQPLMVLPPAAAAVMRPAPQQAAPIRLPSNLAPATSQPAPTWLTPSVPAPVFTPYPSGPALLQMPVYPSSGQPSSAIPSDLLSPLAATRGSTRVASKRSSHSATATTVAAANIAAKSGTRTSKLHRAADGMPAPLIAAAASDLTPYLSSATPPSPPCTPTACVSGNATTSHKRHKRRRSSASAKASTPASAAAPAPAAMAYLQPMQAVAPVSGVYAVPVYGYPSYSLAVPSTAPVASPAVQPLPLPLYTAVATPLDPRTAAVATPAPVSTLRDELADMERGRATTLQVGSQFRTRSGEAGLSSLTEFKVPIELQTSVGDGRLSLQAIPVVVDAGTPAPDYNTVSRFGGGPAVSLGSSGSPGGQSDQGLALSVGYSVDGLDLRLGTTPIGFEYVDFTGRAAWRGTIGEGRGTSIGVELNRRQLDDSVLSMAGAYDSRTREHWGGMMATGLRMDISGDEGNGEVYGWVSVDAINGHHVANNVKAEIGGGVNFKLLNSASESVVLGARLTLLGYQKNQRFFTYGQGGYFSPQTFISLAMPVEWKLRSGKTRVELGGAVGIQGFREDAADYFPSSAARQAAAVAAAKKAVQLQLTTADPTAVYPGQSKVGLSYEMHGKLSYELSNRLQLVGQLGLDNARDYRQFSGGVSLRYTFGQSSEVQQPPLRLSNSSAR